VEAKKAAPRPSPSQSGLPVPRARISSGRSSSSHAVAMAPSSRSSVGAVCPRERSASAKMISESTVIAGWARSIASRANRSSSLTMIPLWTPTTRP
jgi:hypothetical protein